MLRTLRRLDEIAAYAEEKRQPVGSEAFLKHVVDATGADHLARPGIHFRRVRPVAARVEIEFRAPHAIDATLSPELHLLDDVERNSLVDFHTGRRAAPGPVQAFA